MDAINTKVKKEVQELDAICADLGVKEIKYLPSPKVGKVNFGELAKHAAEMLGIYKKHIEGDKNAPIRQIFVED